MYKQPLLINDINDECITIIRNGGLAVFPTETLYGLGSVANNEASLQKLFDAKERSTGQPPPVLISNEQQLWSLIESCNAVASSLMKTYWPGFLTLILPARQGLSPLLTGVLANGSTPTIGVRMSSHPIARSLCEAVGAPIVATSANISGATGRAANPQTIDDVADVLKSRVDVVIDGGVVRGQPSTVVDCTGDMPRILRHGAIELSEEELRIR